MAMWMSCCSRPANHRGCSGMTEATGAHGSGCSSSARASARDAIGAQVMVTAGGATQRRVIAGGTSYCAVSDRRLVFGLGEAQQVDRLEVRWPNGESI
jgi:enediyne biosynthesis protein E4